MESDVKFRDRVAAVTGFSLEEIPSGGASELRPSMRRVARYLPGGGREYVYERQPEDWRHSQVLAGSSEDDPRGAEDVWTVRFKRPGSDSYESVEAVDFAIARKDAGWANETWAPSAENGEALAGADVHGVEVTGDKRGLTFLARLARRA